MCGGGDGGGDGGGEGSDLGPAGWTADGELSDGRGHSTSGSNFGAAPSGSVSGNFDDADPYGATYNNADSTIGRWMGSTRSDQAIANDRAVTDAMGRGDNTFINDRGKSQTVSSYSRSASPPTAGSFLANMNSAPTISGFLGAAASMLVGGIPGIVAGQAVSKAGSYMLGNSDKLGK